MNKLYSRVLNLVTVLCMFGFMPNVQAQLTGGNFVKNPGITYELRADQFRGTCDNDAGGFPLYNDDDNVVVLSYSSDGNTGGSTNWYNGAQGDGSGDQSGCNNGWYQSWKCDGPCNSGGSLNRLLYRGVDRSGQSTFTIRGRAFEDDGAFGWLCVSSGNDCYRDGYYAVSFNTSTKIPGSWWGPHNGTGANWVESSRWSGNMGGSAGDATIKTAVRFTHGNSCGDPLDLGELPVGCSWGLKHTNYNYDAPSGASSDLGYTNTVGNTSPDVFYQFTLSQTSSVRITTAAPNGANPSTTTNFDTYLRLYNSNCSSELAANDDAGGDAGNRSTINYTNLPAGTYKVAVEGYSTNQGRFELHIISTTTPSIPADPGFTTNTWTISAWNGGSQNLDLTGMTRRGYYQESAEDFNTTSRWLNNLSPSYANGYIGQCIGSDNFTMVAKRRQNMSCGVYTISIPTHDDNVRVYIDGTQRIGDVGCCDNNPSYTAYMSGNTDFEVRVEENGGGADFSVNLAPASVTGLNGGSIGGISGGTDVCAGNDVSGSFTDTGTPYGGTIGQNLAPSPQYQWQLNGSNISGATGLNYNPNTTGLPVGTHTYRRRVYDGCNYAYSNSITIDVVGNTAPTAISADANGSCTRWRARWNSVFGATGYRIDIATDAGFSNLVVSNAYTTSTTYDIFQPNGTYYYRVRAITVCGTSGNSNTVSVTLTNGSNNNMFHDAIDITSTIASGSTYNTTWTNNGYTEEGGEPHSGDQYASGWYKFKTPPGGLTNVTASISEGSGNNSSIGIYLANSLCPFNLSERDWERWCFSSGGSVSTNCLLGDRWYYVQVATSDNFAACIGGNNTGSYNVSVNPGTVGGPDNVCSAHDFGAIAQNYDSGNIYYNNSCLSTQSGEQRTGDMSHTMWYKFTTPAAGLNQVTIDVAEAGEGANYTAVTLYRKSGSCSGTSGLTEVAFDRWCNADGGSITADCLWGGTDYYIQLGTGYNFALCTDLINGGRSTGRYRLRLTSNNYESSPDNVCLPADYLFNMNSSSGSYSKNNQSNICAGTQSGEPGGGQNTVWFYFTTGNTVGKDFTINMDAETNGLNSDVYVYEVCGNPCSGGLTGSPNWGNFTELDNFFDVNPLPGEFDAGGTITGKIKPNSTYYIRADGVATVGTDGGFDLDISWSGSFNGNDNFCDAWLAGTSNSPGGSGAGHSESVSNNNILDLGETINIPSFSNKSASAEENCSLNEPQVDEDDETVWIKFTTGNSVGSEIYIDVNATNGEGGVCVGGVTTAGWVKIYEETGTVDCNNWDPNTNEFSNIGVPADVSVGIDVSDITLGCPQPNTTYWLQVETGGLSTCDRADFTMTIQDNGIAEASDVCATATVLPGGPLGAGGTVGNSGATWSNLCATNSGEGGLPAGCIFGIDHGVWFTFTTGTGVGTVNLSGFNNGGDNIDLQLTIFEGPCGSLTEIDCDYDPSITLCVDGLCDEDLNDVCVKENTTYYVLVDGGGTGIDGLEQGIFGLTVSENGPYPANDLICGATDVPTQTIYTYNSYNVNDDNTNGTNCWEPDPDWTFEILQDNDHAVWYYLGDVPGRTVVVDANNLSGDNIDIQMALYSSTTPKGSCTTPASSPTLVEVDKAYDGGGAGFYSEDAYFNCLDPNLYYWLMVDGSGSATGLISATEEGTFSLRIWNPEEGETSFCNAETIGGGVQIPDGGSQTRLNLSNKCGTGSYASMGTSGTVFGNSNFNINDAVIYSFVAPNSGSVKILAESNPYYPGQMGTLTGDEVDLQLAVYEKASQAAPCNTADYFVKGSSYDVTDLYLSPSGASPFYEDMIVNCLVAGREYFILVDGSGLNGSGYYNLTVSDYGVTTDNDFLCDAVPFTDTYNASWLNCNYGTSTTVIDQNNYCGTVTNDIGPAGAPANWGSTTGGVWYKFIAPKSGKVEIYAYNTNGELAAPYEEPRINLQLAVYYLPGGYVGTCADLGTEKDRLQYIASESDGSVQDVLDGINVTGHDELMEVECLIPGEEYYIYVDGEGTGLCGDCDRGEFEIQITPDNRDEASPNESMCDAIPLGQPVMGSVVVGTNTSVGGVTTVPTSGYGAGGAFARSHPSVCMRAENNYCKDITGEPAVSGGNFFTDFEPDQTVWYTFIAPATGEVQIDAYNDPNSLGDQLDLQLAVFESSDNTCSGTFQPIKAEYNFGFFSETMTVKCLEPGKMYWLLVDGSTWDIINNNFVEGYFEIGIEAVPATESGPANDDLCVLPGNTLNTNIVNIAYPGSIGASTSVNNQTNRCANVQVGVYPQPTTFTEDADVWYSFTTPATAGPHSVEIEVLSGLPWPFGDAMDPQIALYEGTCASGFTLVEDDYSPVGLPFYETFDFHCLEASTTYYLMVDGSGLNEQGNFSIDMTRINPHPLPTNDDICDVTLGTFSTGDLGTLGASAGNTVGNTTTDWHNFCSDVQLNEDDLMTDGNYSLDQTVWFHFKTPNTVNNVDVEIRALSDPNNVGDEIDLQMLLVQGMPGCPSGASTFSAMSPIESDDPLLTFNSTLNVCLAPDTDYWIQVDGSGLNTQGYFTLEVENMGNTSGPPNDDICQAKPLPADGIITGSYKGYGNDNNNCATLELGEVQYSPGGIQRSVWYKFVAPTSADVTIEVAGNSFIPFTSDYFLPDVTIWWLNDGTYASPASTIACGGTPAAPSNWSVLEYEDDQFIPNSLANGIYPTVELTPLCLKPGYTYYVQVDGVAGIGLDGDFSINIRDNQPAYSGPSNNEAAGATDITSIITSTSCQLADGTWSAQYSFGNNPTWSNPSLINNEVSSCPENCGDVWFKFVAPPPCGNHTKTFLKIEGDDEFNFDLDGYGELTIAAFNAGPTDDRSNMQYIECSNGGGAGVDADMSIAVDPGDYIYLQVWDRLGDEQGKNFRLCVSEHISSDDCSDATDMELETPYCFSVAAHGPETPSAAVPGSGLMSFCGSGAPEHSTYFKFTTEDINDFCDDYYIYFDLEGLAKEIAGPGLENCGAGLVPSVEFTATIWQQLSATECTPGAANVTQRDCYNWNDCGTGAFGINVTGPHGNGGVIKDTVWLDQNAPFTLLPNTTYYIVLDYTEGLNPFSNRYVANGTIEVGRRCKGRTWEAVTSTRTATDYCTTRDGWRHYFYDNGTPLVPQDDNFLFSLHPNGNNIEGIAKVVIQDPNPYDHYAAVNIPIEGSFVMKRYWDFVLTSGTINPANPVQVRFYYEDAEKQAVIDAAQAFATTHGLIYEPFEWFKSENGVEFNHFQHVFPSSVIADYSETGCFSFFDENGVYIPGGYQRCNTLAVLDLQQSCNGVRYVEVSGLTGFSGGTGTAGASKYATSPLPVELISFVGWNEGTVNQLEWVTASEINNEMFVVERSVDGVNFVEIGSVPGNGTTDESHTYNLTDYTPIVGINYYRLRQIDFDGTFEYSSTIAIEVEGTTVQSTIVQLHPNPTSHYLNVQLQSAVATDWDMVVRDVTGRLVHEETINANAGLNAPFALDVFKYPNGVYIITMVDQTTGERLEAKFVKQ